MDTSNAATIDSGRLLGSSWCGLGKVGQGPLVNEGKPTTETKLAENNKTNATENMGSAALNNNVEKRMAHTASAALCHVFCCLQCRPETAGINQYTLR